MSLAAKHSRPFTHDGIAYRYTVFLNSGCYDLTVQLASGDGQKLVMQFDILEIGQVSVTPKHASEAIDFALKNGWTPNKRNKKPFKGRFDRSRRFLTWPEVMASLEC